MASGHQDWTWTSAKVDAQDGADRGLSEAEDKPTTSAAQDGSVPAAGKAITRPNHVVW